jgi:cephalosporin hydroxylase
MLRLFSRSSTELTRMTKIARFDAPESASKQERLIDDFNRLYYHGPEGEPLYKTTSWLGVPTLKCPLDLWIYQEIVYRTRPEVIVETGVHCGGSALYLATLCDLIGHGRVLACDISLKLVAPAAHSHPRIELLEGSSIAPQVVERIAQQCRGRRTMVILDSDHSCAHVLAELRAYSPLVTPGCYLICEDTNVNGHPSFPEHGPGPYEAVQQFLAATQNFRIDKDCERLLVTFNPCGYLLRV